MVLVCPLCQDGKGWHCQDEFQLAEHLMDQHFGKTRQYQRCLRCPFCQLVLSDHIVVVMAHLREKGGALEHYCASLFGID